MRLKQVLNEMDKNISNDLGEVSFLIQRDCKQYLKLIKFKDPLYRGMTVRHNTGVKDVRKDRKPFGMDEDEARILNKMLQKNGHARRDQSVLCTADRRHVDMFGSNAYYIFPLDKIKYTWVSTPDINMDSDRYNWTSDAIKMLVYDKTKELIDYGLPDERGGNFVNRGIKRDAWNAKKILKKPIEDYFHTNTGFNRAYDNGFELWFDCKKYYYVRQDYTSGWLKNKQEFIE